MSDPYTRVYGVTLLDDVHNYFPALLYDIDGFHNIQDVLSYVRTETSRRFTTFQEARREYRVSRLNTILQTATGIEARPLDHSMDRFPQVDIIVPLEEQLGDYSSLVTLLHNLDTPTERTDSLPPFVSINPSVNTRLRTPARRLNNNSVHRTIEALYEDVIVHATQEIVDQASTQTTLAADLDTNCSVCQDHMKQGETVRTLTACTHQFHKDCIDPWLLNRSTLCPTCRHDVREGLELSSSDATTSSRSNLRDRMAEEDGEFPGYLMNTLFGRTF